MTNILGIETSCDETASAILSFSDPKDFSILSEKISSQTEIHEKYGGVVPELASREHLRNLPLIVSTVLEEAKLKFSDLDAIAVTIGPGLQGCLLMGLSYARGVSLPHYIPMVGVNHIEGHILAPFLDNKELEFPYLALIVSGGHTEIHIVNGVGDYKCIARTIDDAAGEAFDKSANLLGFSYPGGPKLAALADEYGRTDFSLPKVMRESEGFSFSGLKTAISLLVKKHSNDLKKDESLKASLCFAAQDAIVDALVFKVTEAIRRTGINRVIVSGGVAANRALREKISKISRCKAFFPTKFHSTDNGAMIAYAGAARFLRGERLNQNMGVLSRWPVETVNLSV